MAGHPSDAIFRQFRVSQTPLTYKDALAVQKALGTDRILNIGRALQLNGDRIGEIEKAHPTSDSRKAIAVIDTWLRKQFNDKNAPYNKPESTPNPTWWNIVWAVAHNVGGDNPRKARNIANKYQSYYSTTVEPKYERVDDEEFEESNAANIASELQQVWGKWYEIGFSLELPTSKLDCLEIPGDQMANKMTKMIALWIREGATKDPPFPCWRLLVEAIAASHGGQNKALADTVAQQHTKTSNGTGNSAASQQPMDTEPSTTMDETGQVTGQMSGGARVAMDSFIQAPSHPQPDCDEPVSKLGHRNILDDGGSKKRDSPDDFIVYPCNKYSGGKQKPHGLALIITNEIFDEGTELSRRVCAPYDQTRLEKSLDNLGYRVVVKNNQTGDQMATLLEEVGKNTSEDPNMHIKNEDDSFICIISSHGEWDNKLNTDVILGRDRSPLDLQKKAYDTLGATACRLLKGKPKLFFIQACRGDQHGNLAEDGGMTSKAAPRKLPRESDFLFSYSTAPMTKAYRFDPDPDKLQPEGTPIDLSSEENHEKWNIGSFFITELCFAFDRFAPKMDLMNIMLSVHQQLSATEKNIFKKGSKKYRQCPHMTLSLRGPVFFYDKAHSLYKDYIKNCIK